MIKKKALIFFVLLFVFPSVSAFSVLNIYLDDGGDALFLGYSDVLDLELPSGVEINENGEVSGVTSDLTSKDGSSWMFSYFLEDSEMNVFMPEEILIEEISGGEIYLDNGRIVVIVDNGLDVSYTFRGGGDDLKLGIWLIVILLVVLVFLSVYFVTKKRGKKIKEKNEKLEIVKEVLNEREKLIVEKLKKTGKIKSSYLRRLCDIPKASFSRHLQELEKKGLIRRDGEGKNKFVELIR